MWFCCCILFFALQFFVTWLDANTWNSYLYIHVCNNMQPLSTQDIRRHQSLTKSRVWYGAVEYGSSSVRVQHSKELPCEVKANLCMKGFFFPYHYFGGRFEVYKSRNVCNTHSWSDTYTCMSCACQPAASPPPPSYSDSTRLNPSLRSVSGINSQR